MTKDEIDNIAWVIAAFVCAYWVTKNWRVFLRDYFAAKAMNGILETAIDWFPTNKPPNEESLAIFADLAQDSYAIADAMLKARNK